MTTENQPDTEPANLRRLRRLVTTLMIVLIIGFVIIVGLFVFAAVATPSADPFTMTFMAVPMVLLFFVAEIIARWNDRRRARNKPYAGLSPDEASQL